MPERAIERVSKVVSLGNGLAVACDLSDLFCVFFENVSPVCCVVVGFGLHSEQEEILVG